MCNNSQLGSFFNGGSWCKRLPQKVKLFEKSIEPTTEPTTTKAPPLNPQWSNQSVWSDEPSKSGQECLLQQQTKCEDQVHSIDSEECGETGSHRGALSLSLMCASKGQTHRLSVVRVSLLEPKHAHHINQSQTRFDFFQELTVTHKKQSHIQSCIDAVNQTTNRSHTNHHHHHHPPTKGREATHNNNDHETRNNNLYYTQRN